MEVVGGTQTSHGTASPESMIERVRYHKLLYINPPKWQSDLSQSHAPTPPVQVLETTRTRFAAFISKFDPAYAFVACVFLTLTIVYLRFELRHSYPIPYWDEEAFVPYVTGEHNIDLAWLWKGANEHRMPIVRLLYVFLARIGRYDIRVINAANVGMLAITVVLVLLALRRINGKTQYTDALVPFVLLTFGQDTNIQYSFPTCLACLVVALFALHRIPGIRCGINSWDL